MAKSPTKQPTSRSRQAKGAPGPVGPGNPPIHSRFRPGQSGNPAGRPRKERSLLKLIEAELDVEISLTENGETRRLSKREALAKLMVNGALQGDAKAVQTLIRFVGLGNANDEANLVEVDPAIVASLLQRLPGAAGGAA